MTLFDIFASELNTFPQVGKLVSEVDESLPNTFDFPSKVEDDGECASKSTADWVMMDWRVIGSAAV